MIVALNIIAVEQCNTPQETFKMVVQLNIYDAKPSEAITIYHSSENFLQINSNNYFLSDPGSKNRVGGYHYLSIQSVYTSRPPV